MMSNFEFANKGFLWLLILVPLIGAWFFMKRHKDQATLKTSNIAAFKLQSSFITKLKPLLYILRLLALILLILALARPRNVAVSKKSKTVRGIDIVMAIDVSASMLARDLKPNRLEALKKVAERFVNKRPNDRIGVVVYAGESFTQTPITSDKRIVINTIRKLHWGELEGGTAIGMGLGTAINRIKDSKAKTKVIILLTDGVNNTGFVDPKLATELAKNLGIKVYTIGLGTNGMALFPVAKDMNGKLKFGYAKVEIDEDLLKYIATQTEGTYFRATNNKSLSAVYDEINKLEKTKIEEFKYYNFSEKYRFLILLAGALLFIEGFLRFTLFKSLI